MGVSLSLGLTTTPRPAMDTIMFKNRRNVYAMGREGEEREREEEERGGEGERMGGEGREGKERGRMKKKIVNTINIKGK